LGAAVLFLADSRDSAAQLRQCGALECGKSGRYLSYSVRYIDYFACYLGYYA
jgi:hypothetical protein